MQITLRPMRGDRPLQLERSGDRLIVDGEMFDFTPLPDGATLPRDAVACRWLADDVRRIGGVLHLTLVLPHGPDAPHDTRFPSNVAMTGDGPVPLPPFGPEETPDEH